MQKGKNISSLNLKEILKRKLPPSSYEVIRLPTPAIQITKKAKCSEEEGAKRQNFTLPVTSRAEEFRVKLDAKYPSFIKALVKSHVSGSFWMGLPHLFCRNYLPQSDTYFILESEDGKQYKTKFLAQKTAFSGGWKGFSASEKLLIGDVLVFQLVSSAKFKVYRFRDSDSNDVNGAHIAPNVGTQADQSATAEPDSASMEENMDIQYAFSCRGISRDEDHEVPSVEQNVEMHQTPSPAAVSQDKDHEVPSEDDCGIVQEANDTENNGPKFDSGNSEHWQFAPSVDCFGTFDDFVIIIDKLLNSCYDLPQHIKWSYYQLCSSQNAFLHVGLLKGINPLMVAGCIIETVDIANAMKSCELSTFQSEYAIWDEKLNSLKAFGMNVAFLCAHLHHLQRISCNPELTKIVQHYMDQSSELTDTAHKIKSLKDKLSELIRVSEQRADEIDKLKTVIKKHELRFQEQRTQNLKKLLVLMILNC